MNERAALAADLGMTPGALGVAATRMRQRYRTLVEEVTRNNRVWFATAGEAVEWFRWRRSIRFTQDTSSGAVTVAAVAPRASIPAGVIRINDAQRTPHGVDERRFDGREPVTVSL